MNPKNLTCQNCNTSFVVEDKDQEELKLCNKCIKKYLSDLQTEEDLKEKNEKRNN